jgi:diguanylate cyclase (GGDEF)-like protein/PAS domain S-box-containing protein
MFVDLLNNAVYLLALGVVYDVLELRSIKGKQTREALTGLLIGVIGIVVMLTPWEVVPGVYIDTRWVLIALCGLFFGLIPTLIALIITIAFRLFLGGDGVHVGSFVLLVAAMFGLGWRSLAKQVHLSLDWVQLLVFGIATEMLMIMSMTFFPSNLEQRILAEMTPAVLAIHPVATLLLGLILRRQQDQHSARKALLISENRFRSLFESSEVAIWNMGFIEVYERLNELRHQGVTDLRLCIQQNPQLLTELISKSKVIQVNDAFLRLFGAESKQEFLELRDRLFTPDIIEVFVDAFCAIWEGRTKFRAEVRAQTLIGEEKIISGYMPIPVNKDDYYSIPVSILDITELKQAEERVHTLSQAVEQSPVSVLITDPRGGIEYVNSRFEQVTGYRASEVKGLNPNILKSGNIKAEEYKKLWDTISKGGSWKGEFQNKKKNGDLFWESAHIAPVVDRNGTIRHYLAVKEDITNQKEQEERILYQAHYDSLTDLPNRFLSLDRLSQHIKEAERNDLKVAVLFLDLDDFKKVNDTIGHDAGDRLLMQAAQRLKEAVRDGDTIGRLGGDEFIMLLGGLSDVIDARSAAENLLEKFRNPFSLDGRELILGASIGISIYPDDGETTIELLRCADTAMYCSKNQGRNTYNYFTESMNKDVSRRLMLEEKLHGALERNEFSLRYQPMFDIKECRIVGAEALLVWNNQEIGNISPEEFIPITEQSGLIVPIGKFVLTEALRMAAKWQQSLMSDFVISVNFSPRQFRDPGMVNDVESILQESGVESRFLELEITEGVLLSGISNNDASLNALCELGIKMAMDDFGTGYSSLNYLRRYPFDSIKIDRDFVSDMTYDMGDRELVSAAIVMAHSLDLRVVAEGVETEGQLRDLEKLECDYAQGYFFGRPVPAEEFTALLEQQMCVSG